MGVGGIQVAVTVGAPAQLEIHGAVPSSEGGHLAEDAGPLAAYPDDGTAGIWNSSPRRRLVRELSVSSSIPHCSHNRHRPRRRGRRDERSSESRRPAYCRSPSCPAATRREDSATKIPRSASAPCAMRIQKLFEIPNVRKDSAPQDVAFRGSEAQVPAGVWRHSPASRWAASRPHIGNTPRRAYGDSECLMEMPCAAGDAGRVRPCSGAFSCAAFHGDIGLPVSRLIEWWDSTTGVPQAMLRNLARSVICRCYRQHQRGDARHFPLAGPWRG